MKVEMGVVVCRRHWGLYSKGDTGVDRVKGEGVGLHRVEMMVETELNKMKVEMGCSCVQEILGGYTP